MRDEFNRLLIAVMFLTRLPVSRLVKYDLEHLSKSTVYFPLVGAIVGSVGALTLWIASLKFPSTLAVLISMAATILLTGAFHEDGLADSADGFGGGYTKERILEIMKDSRIGTYGAIALWLFLTAKLLLLSEIFKQDDSLALATLIVAHLLGRYSSLPLIFTLDYARSESICGKNVVETPAGCKFLHDLLVSNLVGVEYTCCDGRDAYRYAFFGNVFQEENRRNYGRCTRRGKSTLRTMRLCGNLSLLVKRLVGMSETNPRVCVQATRQARCYDNRDEFL